MKQIFGGISVVLAINSLSFTSWAVEKTQCQLSTDRARPSKAPQVIIYPESGVTYGDEVQVDFVIPTLSANGNDTKRFIKIKDVDGSVSLMLSLYLAQNSDLAPADIDALLIKALQKRKAFWEDDLAKQKHTPPVTPNSGVEPLLIENSLATNNLLLKDNKTSLTSEERKVLITEVLGTMTDYDKTFKYEYREFEGGRFVSKGAKRLEDIFPPELYQSASSTRGKGLIKDKEKAGITNCEYLPTLGHLPKAGDLKSIRRPGQR